MKTKIIIGVVIGVIILVVAIIFIIVNKKSGTEDKYIGFWKENQDTYKVTKGNDGYYEIFTVGGSTTTPDFFGKYDRNKKILIVHVTGNNAGGLEDKNSLFAEERMNKEPTAYDCWVYNEKKQIDVYYKSAYDKGNLDLQEKQELIRVDDK